MIIQRGLSKILSYPAGAMRVMSQTVVSSAFSPTDIPGLKVWLKADGTLWQDSGRTTAVTADGQVVGAWDDASGNGNHLLQATTANKPLYKTSIVNGKPVVRFDGVDDKMSKTFTLVQPEDIYIVSKFTTTTGTNKSLMDGTNGVNFMRVYEANTKNAMHAGANFNGPAFTITNFALQRYLFNSTSSEHRINSTTVSTGNAGTNDGGGLYLAVRGDGGAEFGDVDIAEVIIYDSALSDANRANVETYLNDRYAIY